MNAKDKYNCTPLLLACHKRHVHVIHVLLKAGSNPNIALEGVGCLMCAVLSGCSKEVLQAIIDHDADVNATNKNNFSALMIACENGNVDAIHVLLKVGSNTNIVGTYGRTSLILAVYSDSSKEVLQAIIDHGADVNATDKNNYTALMIACWKGHVNAIHVLLKAGSDTNIANESGTTCLLHAVNSNCSKEVLQAIMDHGADVNATRKGNYTVLMKACEIRHEDAIYVILKVGYDTNIADQNGNTCLLYAVNNNCNKKVLQAIIDYGADVNATDKDNYIALMKACAIGHVDAIHVLLKTGADTNIVDTKGHTSLMCAVGRDCSKEVLQAIIDHGTDVNATDKDNETALMRSCCKRHVDAIHELLKAGSDTNIANKSGHTSLMYDVHLNCSTEVLQALIHNGADVNATDKNSCTTLMVGCEKGHVDAIHALK